MRLATVILVLAVIAAALVHLRRREITVRYEIQRLQAQQVRLRRKLWDQQVRLGCLTAPGEIRSRAEQMVMRNGQAGGYLARRDAGNGTHR